jgi:hypothetical protein
LRPCFTCARPHCSPGYACQLRFARGCARRRCDVRWSGRETALLSAAAHARSPAARSASAVGLGRAHCGAACCNRRSRRPSHLDGVSASHISRELAGVPDLEGVRSCNLDRLCRLFVDLMHSLHLRTRPPFAAAACRVHYASVTSRAVWIRDSRSWCVFAAGGESVELPQ